MWLVFRVFACKWWEGWPWNGCANTTEKLAIHILHLGDFLKTYFWECLQISISKKKTKKHWHFVLGGGEGSFSPYFEKFQVDVSENSGTPKSSILIGFSIIIINHPFWGTPIFWKHPGCHPLKNPHFFSEVKWSSLWGWNSSQTAGGIFRPRRWIPGLVAS